jgi:HD-GYP domain-containing protein (c-di-GMP phosphodiesterase class II)
MQPSLVQTMVRLIELKDLSTAAHTWRVVLYTRAMAEESGLSHTLIERLTHAAALHDIGKLDIPDNVLQKPARLDPHEYDIIKQHAALGHTRLLELDDSDRIDLDLVRHHHERPDGLGYPDGLRGEQIPIAARHFGVIDTFDALTSVRPSRQQIGERAADEALELLAREAGTRYDAQSVDMFTRLYRTGRLEWILHHFNDAVPILPFDAIRQQSPWSPK